MNYEEKENLSNKLSSYNLSKETSSVVAALVSIGDAGLFHPAFDDDTGEDWYSNIKYCIRGFFYRMRDTKRLKKLPVMLGLVEREMILCALHCSDFNVSVAAKELGTTRSFICRKMKKYDIKINKGTGN